MSKCLRLLFMLVYMVASGFSVGGQNFPMQHYTIEDGLPSNTVYSVYRDSKGYIWIATDKGVARYNGVRFEVFTTFSGLPDNEIFFFKEDNSGRLWFSTYNGELCYFKDNSFHSAVNTPYLKLPFKASFITQITLERDSSINVVFWNSTRFVNIKNDRCRVIDLAGLAARIELKKIIFREKVSESTYKLVLQDGVVLVDTLLNVSKVTAPIAGGRTDSNKPGIYIFDQDQNYLVGGNTIFSTGMEPIKHFDPDFFRKNYLYTVYYNGKEHFLNTNHGIFINDSFQVLGDNKVSCLTQDHQRNYLASTLENGIYIFDKNFIHTKQYDNAYKGKVLYIYKDKANLFFTTTDYNINQLERDKVKCLFNYNSYMPDDIKFSLSPGFFFIDSNYRYYNCYNTGSIVIDNLLDKPLKIKKYKNNIFRSDVIIAIFRIGNILYINAKNRICTIDLTKFKDGQTLEYGVVDDYPNVEKIFGMAKSPENEIWYSTIKNIFKVENGRGIPQTQYKNVTFKVFDFLGKYLVGYTHNNQLMMCRNVKGTIETDSIASQNCIWDKLYKIDSNHVLISTNNYYRLLTLYPGDSERKYSLWTIENPYIPLQAESICSDTANCYFFKNGSITSIDVKSLLAKPDPPELFFTFLKTNKRTYAIGDDIQIPYRESKNITISFSTLTFSGKDVFYQYSVSKNEQDIWRDITGEINLVNAGFGTSVIKIRAKSISSDYSKPALFTLRVSRPYWATWWFITLVSIVSVSLVVLGIRSRIKYVVRKREKLHMQEIRFMRSEYKALNALMNPHFIFNTLNNVQSLFNGNDRLAANEYLRIFADLIRQNMHNISKELIPLQKELDLVKNYLMLEKLRFEELMNFSIEVSDNLDLSDIMVPPLLIQPLVENSIKHGILQLKSDGGFIHIRINEENDILHIEVKDNGVGLNHMHKKTDPRHESFGLDNIRKRIEKLSIIQGKSISFNIAEVVDKHTKIKWTVATISMPIGD